MLKVVISTIFLFSVMFTSQQQKPIVVNISANTKYDASYILGHAQKIVSINEEVQNEKIDCLISELQATGIFTQVETKLIPTNNHNYYWLEINTIYNPDIENFVINDIEMEGFPNIDKNKFFQTLGKTGIRKGTRFLKYNLSSIREKVVSTIDKVNPMYFKEDPFASTWLTIRTDNLGQVKIVISSFVPKFCS